MKKTIFTTFIIAKLLDVYPTTIANWIDQGKLKAFSTPGGHRRVANKDLLEFLKKYKMPVPDELIILKSPNKKKVLIVDDDPKVLKSIAAVLKKKSKKYTVFTATDGFEAGQAVIELKPDLMILDIMLPGIDGFKVCRTTRKKNKEIKIIAVTGYHDEKNKKKILSAGADFYLRKPINIDELLNRMNDLLGKKRRGQNGSNN